MDEQDGATPVAEPAGAPPGPADASASDDPLLAAMTGVLDGTTPLDPFAMLKAQLEARGGPRAALVLRFLEQRRRQEAEALAPQQEEAEEVPAEADEVPAMEAEGDMLQIQQAVETLYVELAVLRARCDTLAAALGACPACLGDEPGCEECGGLGRPGFGRPDPKAFRKYVLPAVGRARSIDQRRTNERSADERASRSGPGWPRTVDRGVRRPGVLEPIPATVEER